MKIHSQLKHADSPALLILHGFTESSACFQDAWMLPELENYNIFIPDLPGFGESPLPIDGQIDFVDVANELADYINENSKPTATLYVIGHSLGGAIGVELTYRLLLTRQNIFFLNIDGLLVEEQKPISSLSFADEYTSSDEYKDFVIQYWVERTGDDFYLKRYLDNIISVPSKALHAWAKASIKYLAQNNALSLLTELKEHTIYIYGANSINKRNIDAVLKSGVVLEKIDKSGHWPMLDNKEVFWEIVRKCLDSFEMKFNDTQASNALNRFAH